VVPDVPGWPFRDMSKDEIHEFRRILSTVEGIRIRIADLPKCIFYVNGDGKVEEDFGRLDYDRLTAWVD
jgi:hypothetical protein